MMSSQGKARSQPGTGMLFTQPNNTTNPTATPNMFMMSARNSASIDKAAAEEARIAAEKAAAEEARIAAEKAAAEEVRIAAEKAAPNENDEEHIKIERIE